jgi:hypothetical protein
MPPPVIYSIIDTPGQPDFSKLYQRLGLTEIKHSSMRKAIGDLKRRKPDFVVAEFRFGYGNNYAGVNISNLDVFLYSLQKYAPHARVIVTLDKNERRHLDKLTKIFPLHGSLTYPIVPAEMEALLRPREAAAASDA